MTNSSCQPTKGSAGTSLRSARWYERDDMRAFAHRQRTQQMGLRREKFLGRAVIAIVNTWSDMSPCHVHLRDRAEAVKRDVKTGAGTHTKKYRDELRAGNITADDWIDLESRMTRSTGTCNTMGLTLTGASSIPAAFRNGVVALTLEDLAAAAREPPVFVKLQDRLDVSAGRDFVGVEPVGHVADAIGTERLA